VPGKSTSIRGRSLRRASSHTWTRPKFAYGPNTCRRGGACRQKPPKVAYGVHRKGAKTSGGYMQAYPSRSRLLSITHALGHQMGPSLQMVKIGPGDVRSLLRRQGRGVGEHECCWWWVEGS
jgi:hypothetical protein